MLHKLKNFLRRKKDIRRKNSAMNYVSSIIIFSLGDTFFYVNKIALANNIFTGLNNLKKGIA